MVAVAVAVRYVKPVKGCVARWIIFWNIGFSSFQACPHLPFFPNSKLIACGGFAFVRYLLTVCFCGHERRRVGAPSLEFVLLNECL